MPASELEAMPSELPILPVPGSVIFPLLMIPLALEQESSVRLIDDALAGDRMVALVTLRRPVEWVDELKPDDLYSVGTVAYVQQVLRLPDGTGRIAVKTIERIAIDRTTQYTPYLRGQVHIIPDTPELETGLHAEALVRSLQTLTSQIAEL
jgi:ATP-dependent Lon protease